MAVRAKNHTTAAGQHFSGKLVDHGLMRRYINSAVFFRTGQTKHMIIFIYGTAHRTQAVMAIGKYIRHRELLKA